MYYIDSFGIYPVSFYSKLHVFCLANIGLNIENTKEGGAPYSHRSKREIINLVLANNAIRLREIQAHIVNDHQIFNNVQQ